MRFLLIPVGALVGALIARSFFLNFIEEAAFRAAWELLFHIHLSLGDVRSALRTDTGQKIAAGAVVGACLGFIAAYLMGLFRPARRR